jgi:hypothetical protein
MATSGIGNFFTGLGNLLKKIFSPGAIKVEASVAEMILPGFSPLIAGAASAIIAAEGTAASAGFQTGTGSQKMGIAISLFQSTYNQWAAQNGLTQEPAAVQNVLQNVFNLLQDLNLVNAIAPTGTTLAPPATPAVTAQAKTGTLL